ncbi:VOC family protein [Egbenema bharatensis]|uniref:VOC family protein n=1 Tax=Egbenema bharatensis TaxID=3463334 RepID=UPI003A8530C5
MEFDAVFVTLVDGEGEALVRFYRDLLGLEPIAYSPNRYAEFRVGGLRLGIFQPAADQRSQFYPSPGEPGSSGGMSLCIEVKQLEGAIDRLTELGYPPPGEIRTASHGREIYAYDPAGNRLILHEAKTQSFPNC